MRWRWCHRTIIAAANIPVDVAGIAVEQAANTEVDEPVAGTAETVPPAGNVMAGMASTVAVMTETV